MPDRYAFPGEPLTEAERELLTILQEECAEVIVAASKLLRFGKEHYEGYGDNQTVLALEVGDLLEMISRAQVSKLIPSAEVVNGMIRKQQRLKQFSRTM